MLLEYNLIGGSKLNSEAPEKRSLALRPVLRHIMAEILASLRRTRLNYSRLASPRLAGRACDCLGRLTGEISYLYRCKEMMIPTLIRRDLSARTDSRYFIVWDFVTFLHQLSDLSMISMDVIAIHIWHLYLAIFGRSGMFL